MSYQVLARKWRPRDFSQVIGQQHVVRALSNALTAGQLHQAYLLTGTRGVGKTTLARIIAKCLNCETGITATPCGECGTCQEVDAGRFMDLLEVDAASRSKVDETRELMDNVGLAPAKGRYKVYLIDEVHMFSDKSFNALLKTLEEPPPHVCFLLATTDPQKLPITVLSRCVRLGLKPLPAAQIAGHLATVAEAEGVDAEAPALARLGQAADGSMRDGLTLMEQALAFGDGALKLDEVRDMLGVVDHEHLLLVLEALVARDAQSLVSHVAAMTEAGVDFGELLRELVVELSALAVRQLAPDAVSPGVGHDPAHESRRAAIADGLSPEDVQLYYQFAVMARRDLPYASDERTAFEMAVLRMHAFGMKADGAAPALPGKPPGGSAAAPRPPAASGGVRRPPAVSRAREGSGAGSADAWPAERQGRAPLSSHGAEEVESRPGSGTAPVPGEPAADAVEEPPPWLNEEPPGWLDSIDDGHHVAEESFAQPRSAASGRADTTIARPALNVRDESNAADGKHSPAAPPAPGSRQPRPSAAGGASAPAAGVSASVAGDSSGAASASAATAGATTINVAPVAADATPFLAPSEWPEFVDGLALTGGVRELAANSELVASGKTADGGRLVLRIAPEHAALGGAHFRDRLAKRLSESLLGDEGQVRVDITVEETGASMTLSQRSAAVLAARHRAAVAAAEADPVVQAICATFDTRLEPALVRPVELSRPPADATAMRVNK